MKIIDQPPESGGDIAGLQRKRKTKSVKADEMTHENIKLAMTSMARPSAHGIALVNAATLAATPAAAAKHASSAQPLRKNHALTMPHVHANETTTAIPENSYSAYILRPTVKNLGT